MKLKPFVVGYFVILFAILGSFLVGSLYVPRMWMQVMTADQLSPTQPNAILVWVRDPDRHRQWNPERNTIEAHWIVKEDLTKALNERYAALQRMTANEASQSACRELEDFERVLKRDGKLLEKLGEGEDAVYRLNVYADARSVPPSGKVLIKMPPLWETCRDHGVALRVCFESFEDDEAAAETGCTQIPIEVMTSHVAVKHHDTVNMDSSWWTTWPVAPLMFDMPGEIQILTMTPMGPYRGSIQVEQMYAQTAKFPTTLETKGITRMPLTIPMGSPRADLRFTAGEHEFYASVTPGMKPLSATVSRRFLSPENAFTPISIVSFGSMPTVTVDYFDGDAWIDRQTILPHEVSHAELQPKDYVFGEKPSILYARINNSDVGSQDNSQTVALVASSQTMTMVEQARFAVHEMGRHIDARAQVALLENLIRNASDDAMWQEVRDYALERIADIHAPTIAQRVSTDREDYVRFEAAKAARKSRSNAILIVWFAVGLLGSFGIFYHVNQQNRARRAQIDQESLEVHADEGQGITGILLLIVVLFIGLMVSIYYMMQIL